MARTPLVAALSAAAVAAAATTTFAAAAPPPPPMSSSFCDPGTDWNSEWADEFDGATIDDTKWTVTVGAWPAAAAAASEAAGSHRPRQPHRGRPTESPAAPTTAAGYGADCHGDGCVILGSCRSAACTADNVYLEDGALVLRSQREDAQGLNYTTGAVNTRHKSTWTASPGAFRMCISAKLPGGGGGHSGQGIWPAHWLMPDDDTCDPDEGEIDIMEMVDGTGTVYGTYHWQTSFPQANCSFPKNHSSVSGNVDLSGADWDSTFHEYAVEHSPDYVAFVVDGKVLTNNSRESDALKIWPVPWYLIVNTAVGGGWPGEPSANTTFPTYHVLDYVRVSRRAF